MSSKDLLDNETLPSNSDSIMSIGDTKHISPANNEQPSTFADRLGAAYTKTVSQTFKKDNGQFFTPQAIARFMGNLVSANKTQVDILDPGCGTAVLTCALVENLVEKHPNIEVINLVAYETDSNLISLSEKSLSYLKDWLSKKGISLQYIIRVHDFIVEY